MSIKKLNIYCKFNEGIFSNPNMQKAAIAINALLKKTDEQTEVINQLLKEVQELKNNHKDGE